MNMKKIFSKTNKESVAAVEASEVETAKSFDQVKAHKMGDLSLTVTTLILVAVSIYCDAYFAPFIILLMSSRIGASIYTIIKTAAKREMAKLVLWVSLCANSAFSYFQLLM